MIQKVSEDQGVVRVLKKKRGHAVDLETDRIPQNIPEVTLITDEAIREKVRNLLKGETAEDLDLLAVAKHGAGPVVSPVRCSAGNHSHMKFT